EALPRLARPMRPFARNAQRAAPPEELPTGVWGLMEVKREPFVAAPVTPPAALSNPPAKLTAAAPAVPGGPKPSPKPETKPAEKPTADRSATKPANGSLVKP